VAQDKPQRAEVLLFGAEAADAASSTEMGRGGQAVQGRLRSFAEKLRDRSLPQQSFTVPVFSRSPRNLPCAMRQEEPLFRMRINAPNRT